MTTPTALVNTSVADALSGAHAYPTRTIQNAIRLEQKRPWPRTALIEGFQRELRKRSKQRTA